MKVQKIAVTPEAEKTIVYIARVSSSRKDKNEEVEKLINYLIKHKHFSPFEHAYLTLEITTSKAIGIQLLRHRSFTFQEFSQRYAEVTEFEDVELRKQAENNRQSSEEVFDPEIFIDWSDAEIQDLVGEEYGALSASELVEILNNTIYSAYGKLLEAGIARECARMILPMCTQTTIYMTGNIRSWIHFLDTRDDEHAQKEIQLVAKEVKKIFIAEFPIISQALKYE